MNYVQGEGNVEMLTSSRNHNNAFYCSHSFLVCETLNVMFSPPPNSPAWW